MRILMIAAGFQVLAGCAFVNSESYRMLDVGMNADEVEGIWETQLIVRAITVQESAFGRMMRKRLK